MSERLTKEEVEALKQELLAHSNARLDRFESLQVLATIQFLEKALEQAERVAGLELRRRLNLAHPELAEYLRSLTPPQVQK